MKKTKIGIDIGGTKIEVCVLSSENEIIYRHREPTPRDYQNTILTIKNLVEGAIQNIEKNSHLQSNYHKNLYTLGIGMPGSIIPKTGVVHNSNALHLNGKSFKQDIEHALNMPIIITNDANCLAISEAIGGMADKSNNVFALIIGTGCGAGSFINGKINNGITGIASEIGHISLPWPNKEEIQEDACWCGRHNCIEQWISGVAIERNFEKLSNIKLSANEIFGLAAKEDPEASRIINAFYSQLGRVFAMIANFADPEYIIIAGGVSNVNNIIENSRIYMKDYIFGGQWNGHIAKAKYGDSSGVRGAALLWEEELVLQAKLNSIIL